MGYSVSDAFPSRWLKADDVEGTLNVVINNVTMEDVQKGEPQKLVVWLQGQEKGIVLNKTNASNISGVYGDNTDGWIGKTMELGTTYVDFNGRSTLSLRLYPPRNQGTGGFVSGAAPRPSNDMNSDPRGDIPPANGEQDYGAASGG